MSIFRIPIIGLILRYAEGLRFRQLFLITGSLFLLDLIIPDFIPFIDELLLGLLTLLFASWKKPEPPAPPQRRERVIDGEAERVD